MFFRKPATFACTSICWKGRKSAAIVKVSARSRRSAFTTATVVRGSPGGAAACDFEHAVADARGTTVATASTYSSLAIGSVVLITPLRASRGRAGRPQSIFPDVDRERFSRASADDVRPSVG